MIERANDRTALKEFTPQEDSMLCSEIRDFLIDSVSKTGGHLASNLGAVELTVALHKVFDPYTDRIIFDVGHQSYVHKLLTGRKDGFAQLRQFGGMSGFPKPHESQADAFIAGHASNSVSVALGMARARTISNEHYNVVAVIGDGALTGGLAYEGLNDAGQSGEPMIVILNDNGMSIQPNVGAISKFLARQRIRPSYLSAKRAFRAASEAVPGGKAVYRVVHKFKTWLKKKLIGSTIFDQMGFMYLGPVDGHDISKLTYVLQQAKEIKAPVLIHIRTKKGLGYAYAEENPDAYHGVSAFDPEKGTATGEKKKESFSSAFGKTMCAMASEDRRICAVTAAMEQGTGLTQFAKDYPKHFFDVGIAEGHAVTMASGLAKQGLLPVFAVYSTFLQRAYDNLLHDTALLNLHLVLAVDRAGLVGNDGETHHGTFDVCYLRTIPHMQVYSPASTEELRKTLHYAVYDLTGPVAVRYPRGGNEPMYAECNLQDVILCAGSDCTIVTYGTLVNEALIAAEQLEQSGISTEIVKLLKISPLDLSLIRTSIQKTKALVVVEECVSHGCVGQEIVSELSVKCELPKLVRLINLGDDFVTHGNISQLRWAWGIDGSSIATTIKELLGHEKAEN